MRPLRSVIGAVLAPPSLPTTVTCTCVPNGRPPCVASARQTISKPLLGRLDASRRLLSFGKPGAGAIAGGAPPPGMNAPASTTWIVFVETVEDAIDSLKRIRMSGLVGPKIRVRTSATFVWPGWGVGGAAPAPTPDAPLTGTVVTTIGSITSAKPTVKLAKTGVLSTGSPSTLFRFAKMPIEYWPSGRGSIAGVKMIRSSRTWTPFTAGTRGMLPVPGMNWRNWIADRSRPRAGLPPMKTDRGSSCVVPWKNTTILPG